MRQETKHLIYMILADGRLPYDVLKDMAIIAASSTGTLVHDQTSEQAEQIYDIMEDGFLG